MVLLIDPVGADAAIISLIVLVFTSKNSRAPKAEGIPCDKGQW